MWSHRGRGWASGFDFAGRGPRWGGRGRLFGPGDMKFVVLRLLEDKAMHGYEVMKALEEQSQGFYKASPGTVYPTLQWLEDEDLVVKEAREGDKKIYSITEAGKKFLVENQSTVEEIFERLEDMADYLGGGRMPEIGREIRQLVRQAFRVAWRSRDDATSRQIVEILKGARRQIRELGKEAP